VNPGPSPVVATQKRGRRDMRKPGPSALATRDRYPIALKARNTFARDTAWQGPGPNGRPRDRQAKTSVIKLRQRPVETANRQTR